MMPRWIPRILIAILTFFLGVASFVVRHKTPSNSPPQGQRVWKPATHERSYVIPNGYNAMTVEIDEADAPHPLQLGPRMDLCVVSPGPDHYRSQKKISKVVLENVKVLAVSTYMTIFSRGISSINDSHDSHSRLTLTLQVTPEEAKRLSLAEKEGKLQLVMPALESAPK